MKKIILLLIGTLFFSSLLWAQEVTNVTASQRTDGSKLLDVSYDLAGTEAQYTVTLEISFDDGQTFQPVTQVSGDVGGVEPATALQIVWDAAAEFPEGFYSETMKVQVIAEAAGGWQCGDILVDSRDGQEYTTVQIGEQCWMAENLNIGNRIDGGEEMLDNDIIEKYCDGDSDIRCDQYGGLYQWNEMMQFSNIEGAKGICPDGWYIPSFSEWNSLVAFVESQGFPNEGSNPNGTANALKSCRQTNSPLGGYCTTNEHPRWGFNSTHHGFDEYGFGLLPGGGYVETSFWLLGSMGMYWSSNEHNSTLAFNKKLYYDHGYVEGYIEHKTLAYSVRCLKDTTQQNLPPTTPSDPTPEHNSQDQSIQSTLQWSCSDPENDPLTYDVYFGTSETPGLIASGISDTTYNPGTLDYNTQYYWLIVAHDDQGNTTEGEVWSFTTEVEPAGFTCGDILVDARDGQEYTTVQIGEQCWMAENLNIGTRTNGSSNQSDNGIIEKYCYNNSDAQCDTYGGLYQWNEMMQYTTTSGAQGICPDGWHLPTDAEWCILEQEVDLTITCSSYGARGVDGGGKLKEPGTTHWNSPNTGATNSSGFTALPGGGRDTNGSFSFVGNAGTWLSSSQGVASNVWGRYLSYAGAQVNRFSYGKSYGFSVRCLKD